MIIIECYTKKELMMKVLTKSLAIAIPVVIIACSNNPLKATIYLAKTTVVCKAINITVKQVFNLISL